MKNLINLKSFSANAQRIISKSYSDSDLSELPSVFQFDKKYAPFGLNKVSEYVNYYSFAEISSVKGMKSVFKDAFGSREISYQIELPLSSKTPKGTTLYITGNKNSEPDYYLISIHSNKRGGLLDDIAVLGKDLELLAIEDRYKPLLEGVDISNGNQVIQSLLYDRGYSLFNLTGWSSL